MDEKKFDSLNLSLEVIKAISDMGFEELSPIQQQAIPLIMDKKDVIGQAQTGTGKTAAFGIPVIETVKIWRFDTENGAPLPVSRTARHIKASRGNDDFAVFNVALTDDNAVICGVCRAQIALELVVVDHSGQQRDIGRVFGGRLHGHALGAENDARQRDSQGKCAQQKSGCAFHTSSRLKWGPESGPEPQTPSRRHSGRRPVSTSIPFHLFRKCRSPSEVPPFWLHQYLRSPAAGWSR